MFRAIMTLHWHWLRVPLALLACAALLLPVIGLGGANPAISAYATESILFRATSVGGLVAALAVLTGIVVAWVITAADLAGGHTYALSLPVHRDRFSTLRAASGLLFLPGPAIAIWLGITLAASRVVLPPGVEAYAGMSALRALLVMGMSFSLTIALRSARPLWRRATVLVVLALVGASWVETMVLPSQPNPPIQSLLKILIAGRASPFAVVFSPWPIVDL
jgi:hypothetical protein